MRRAIESFDVRRASCFRAEERDKLLTVIEIGFGGLSVFNEVLVALLGAAMRQRDAARAAESRCTAFRRSHEARSSLSVSAPPSSASSSARGLAIVPAIVPAIVERLARLSMTKRVSANDTASSSLRGTRSSASSAARGVLAVERVFSHRLSPRRAPQETRSVRPPPVGAAAGDPPGGRGVVADGPLGVVEA